MPTAGESVGPRRSPSEHVELRAAVRADAAAMAAMQSGSLAETYGPLLGRDSVEAFMAGGTVERYFDERWPASTVAVAAGEIVGVAVLLGDLLDLIWVDPRLRGQGVGSALLLDAEHRAAATHDRLRLEVWRVNERAVAFYLQHGFAVHDVTVDELGLEKLTLGKALSR
jgi:ribosomal protein S18 acetylase RimI-like enzyme